VGGMTQLWDVWCCLVMRDLEAMSEIQWTERGQGWSMGGFATIAVSRLSEDGVAERIGDGKGETRGFLQFEGHDEALIRSAEMTWLWE
jgi:hypothetical protein